MFSAEQWRAAFKTFSEIQRDLDTAWRDTESEVCKAHGTMIGDGRFGIEAVQLLLVGGLEHFLFSHILGIIIPID